MEHYKSYRSHFNFMRIFSRILMLFLIIVCFVLIFVPINETIDVSDGELLAKKPQIIYTAPFESSRVNVKVKLGEIVDKGDTLAIIENNKIETDEYSVLSDLQSKESALYIVDEIIGNLKERRILLGNKLEDIHRLKEHNLKQLKKEIIIAKEDKNVQKELLNSSFERLKLDSTLYKLKHIAKLEITDTYNKYLKQLIIFNTAKNKLYDTESRIKASKLNYISNNNNVLEEINALKIEINNENKNKYNIQNDVNKFRKKSIDRKIETQKRYLIAECNGTVDFMFNFKNHSNVIQKNETLIKLSPIQNTYYARIYLNEMDLWRIKKGQSVSLKISAFQYLKFGTIKGVVSYIPENYSDLDKPYIQAEIFEYSKFSLKTGYTFTGSIIIQRVKLWKYFVIKLLKSNHIN